ncbi:MAG: response regulator transcription factor [Lachnospirales bacterium]
MRILVVEDDKYLSEALEHILKKDGYFVDKVDNGEDGFYYAQNGEYDAIVLDVMMPKMNGYEVIKKLRDEDISIPTIMLTAKSELDDKVTGLDSGADDYLTKPFEPKELLARLRALTRRVGNVILEELKYEDLTLNIDTQELHTDKRTVLLTNKEFLILKAFLSNPQGVFSKDDLIIKVWGYDSEAEDNNVEAYISFLRKKLEFVETKVAIVTIRKLGYKLGEK